MDQSDLIRELQQLRQKHLPLNEEIISAIDNKLEFEVLISGISAKFSASKMENIVKDIEDGLRMIVEFFNLDRSTLFSFSDDRSMIMKKNAFLLATIFFIAASCSSVKVVTDLDKTADFTKYQTISFLGWQEDIDKVINEFDQERIRNVLKAEMEKRNLKLVDDNGDMVMSTFLVSEQKTSMTAYTNYYGGGAGYGYGRGRRGRGGWGMGGATTTYSESDYVQGTLVIDIFDHQSKELVWQGVGVGTIKENPKKREKSLPKAIATILKDFPIAPVN